MSSHSFHILLCLLAALSSQIALAQDNGFKGNDNQAAPEEESWLKQHNRYIFVVVIGVIVFALLIWYIVRSIRGMRKRLARENDKQMRMIQQMGGSGHQYSNIPETMSVSMHSDYQKYPHSTPVTPTQPTHNYQHRY